MNILILYNTFTGPTHTYIVIHINTRINTRIDALNINSHINTYTIIQPSNGKRGSMLVVIQRYNDTTFARPWSCYNKLYHILFSSTLPFSTYCLSCILDQIIILLLLVFQFTVFYRKNMYPSTSKWLFSLLMRL